MRSDSAGTLAVQAAEAAALWDGQVLRLIANRENAVFEMATPGGRAALRLHRTGYQDARAIRSELWWCAALADVGVAVPTALPSRAGPLLQQLAQGRHASAIRWLPGEPLGRADAPTRMPAKEYQRCYYRLGRVLAKLHAETDLMVLPDDFARPRLDIGGLVGEAPLWGRFWEHPSARPDQAACLRRVRDFLSERLSEHARDGSFGLIHADVLRENVLVDGTDLTLIDFDDCGWGFRLYDLGTAMLQNLDAEDYTDIRDALIDGYSEANHQSVELVEVFTLTRACASVGWTMPRLASDNPVCASHIARAIACAGRLGI